jgi:N-acetylglutamate synthase-like GNAT family acetyltransferase
MITYQVEKFHDILEEFKPIWQVHWEEIALDKDVITLNMDIEKYITLSQTGILLVVTARDDEKLIGYYYGLVNNHLHYKQSLTLFTDIFYILKEYRKGRVGYNLFKYVEQVAKELKVQKIYMGCKLHLDLTSMLNRLGYNQIEKIFAKVI